MQRNPFPVEVAGKVLGWKWYNELGDECRGVFPTQKAALKDLLRYMHWLDNGPTLWQKLWWPIRYELIPVIMKRFRQ